MKNMKCENRNPVIYLISGYSRHGKSTIGDIITNLATLENKDVIISQYGKYIKNYAKEMTDWDGSEETKPRTFLQKLGTDIIRNKLNKSEMFIQRQLDDIEIYSYFYDIVLVTDIRLPREIEAIKEKFDNVVVIRVNRINFDDGLTEEQRNHPIERAMDEYTEYDYIIENDTLEQLEEDVKQIYERDKKNEKINI